MKFLAALGMIEVEKPWMETTSDYPLAENMTFQADTFFAAREFGLRWENGLVVTESGNTLGYTRGVTFEKFENGYAICKVRSGSYRFASKVPKSNK